MFGAQKFVDMTGREAQSLLYNLNKINTVPSTQINVPNNDADVGIVSLNRPWPPTTCAWPIPAGHHETTWSTLDGWLTVHLSITLV